MNVLRNSNKIIRYKEFIRDSDILRSAMYLPLYIDMKGRDVLVLGLGEVGRRRAKKIRDRGGEVKGIDVKDPEIEGIKFEKKKLKKSNLPDLTDYFLVIASTDDKDLNRAITDKAKDSGVLVSCAGDFKEGDVLFPGVLETEENTISITTKGKDPALTKKLKEVIKDEISREKT